MCNGCQLLLLQHQNTDNYGRSLKPICTEVDPVDTRIDVLGDSAHSEARGEGLISLPTPPLMYVMKCAVPLLLAVVILKFQSNEKALFLENPASLWCFLVAISVYWLIVDKLKQMPALDGVWFQTLSRTALASGILSMLSLLSMFLRYPFSLLPLLIWMPVPVALGWPRAYNLFQRGIKGCKDKLVATLVWAKGGHDSTEGVSNLPAV